MASPASGLSQHNRMRGVRKPTPIGRMRHCLGEVLDHGWDHIPRHDRFLAMCVDAVDLGTAATEKERVDTGAWRRCTG